MEKEIKIEDKYKEPTNKFGTPLALDWFRSDLKSFFKKSDNEASQEWILKNMREGKEISEIIGFYDTPNGIVKIFLDKTEFIPELRMQNKKGKNVLANSEDIKDAIKKKVITQLYDLDEVYNK
jgi:hypothetical protein